MIALLSFALILACAGAALLLFAGLHKVDEWVNTTSMSDIQVAALFGIAFLVLAGSIVGLMFLFTGGVT